MTVEFIADIGSNHNGNLSRCIELINQAKQIGCSAVKFQMFDEDLYAPGYTINREILKKRALPFEFLPDISSYCIKNDIQLGMSVFNIEAVEKCNKYVDFFKLGSYEILWIDLIREIAKTKKRFIISAGLCNTGELMDAMGIAAYNNLDLSILHCNSSYPAFTEECDLNKIKKLLSWSTSHIGWSDHTTEPGVIHKAIGLGASIIEFHLDLNGEGWEYLHDHCWLPNNMRQVIHDVRVGEGAIGKMPEDQRQDLLMQRADPSDGMRPLKISRNKEN